MLPQTTDQSVAPAGALDHYRSFTPGLRPGLLSAAASRLIKCPTLVEFGLAEYY